jgi:hypothetical protein
LEYKDGFSDASDPSCQLFILEQGSVVKKAEVIVANDQPVLRQQICFLSLSMRALGLKPDGDKKFSTRWGDDPGSLKTLTKADMPEIIRTVSFRLYIHECVQLNAGMSPYQVREILSDPNGCLKPWVTAKGEQHG